MCSAKGHVRFTPKGGYVRRTSRCPLSAKSVILQASNCRRKRRQTNLVGRQMLSPFKDFDSKYRWQVTRDLLPIFSFIEAREDRATVCAEVDSRWIAFVARHRLTEHSEEATLLRQTLAHPLPVLAAVARPPNCCGCVGRKTSRHVAVEWHRPDDIRIARMDADRKAEGRG